MPMLTSGLRSVSSGVDVLRVCVMDGFAHSLQPTLVVMAPSAVSLTRLEIGGWSWLTA